MNCFPCFSSQKSKNPPCENENRETDEHEFRPPVATAKQTKQTEETEQQTQLKTFNFRELATATKNFRQECLLGEGGFGRVYKGTLQSSGQLVAVKQLDKHGMHGNKEFQAEVLSLAKLEHPNLVQLVGYCADGDQRLLVFEYVPGGSLKDHLYEQKESQKKPMDWITRMKIAFGAAQGLDYLHDKVNPPVIYRDLKASNILLDDEFYPKLCDFGLQNLGPGTGDSLLFNSRAMDTYGYSAPEYTRGDEITVKSDVYSFGVVLLELITGRRAIDTTKPNDEQNLVAWAQPIFRDPKRYPDMADPLLKKNISERGLNQAVAITSMCLQEEPTARPLISDVMVALSFLSMSTEDGIPTAPVLSFRDKSMSIALSRHDSCSVLPLSLNQKDDDDDSSSSSNSEYEEEDEEEEKQESIRGKKKQEGEETDDSDDEFDSNSEKGQVVEHSQSKKSRNSINSSKRSTNDETKYDSNSEEEDDERVSSCKSDEESTFIRYDSNRDHDDSPRKTSMKINSLSHNDSSRSTSSRMNSLAHNDSSSSRMNSLARDDSSRNMSSRINSLSHNNSSRNTSSRIHSLSHDGSPRNMSSRINSRAHSDDEEEEEEEEENQETRLEYKNSSKYEDQSVSSDDDDDGEENHGASLHQIKSQHEGHISSDED